jgi:hypothetical protein
MLPFFSRSSFAVAAATALVVACTTKTIETRTVNATPDGGGATTGNGPPIDASLLGGACSGYGTGIGQTAAFQTEDCAGGVCLVDAREGLSLYCSADCTNATCPEGWECRDVDNGAVTRACFRVEGASNGGDSGTTDAAVASAFEAPLTGYQAGASATTTFSIASFEDPSQTSTDLIVLIVCGRWSVYDQKLMEDLETATLTKTLIVSVLADGTKVGDGATKSDLTAWHTQFPKHAKVLDSQLAVLGPKIGKLAPGEIEAFPTLIGLDASTLNEVGRSTGYEAPESLKTRLEGWRAKTK